MLLFYLVFEGQGEGWWQNISSENEIIFVTKKYENRSPLALIWFRFCFSPLRQVGRRREGEEIVCVRACEGRNGGGKTNKMVRSCRNEIDSVILQPDTVFSPFF